MQRDQYRREASRAQCMERCRCPSLPARQREEPVEDSRRMTYAESRQALEPARVRSAADIINRRLFQAARRNK
jgi:hypothetical protein